MHACMQCMQCMQGEGREGRGREKKGGKGKGGLYTIYNKIQQVKTMFVSCSFITAVQSIMAAARRRRGGRRLMDLSQRDPDEFFHLPGPGQPQPFFLDVQDSRSFKGSGFAQEVTYRVVPHDDVHAWSTVQIEQVLPQLTDMFDQLLDQVREDYNPEDVCRLFINHPEMESAIIVGPQALGYTTAEKIMETVENVLESDVSVPLDADLRINLAVVKKVAGTGGRGQRNLTDLDEDCKKKRSLVTVRSLPDDPLDWFCLPKAIVLARAYQKASALSDDPVAQQKAMNKARSLGALHSVRRLTHQALELMDLSGISRERRGFMEDIPRYEACLQQPIVVLSAFVGNNKLYPGDPVWVEQTCPEDKLYLYFWTPTGQTEGHFDVLTNVGAFLGAAHYCKTCDKAFDHLQSHSCQDFCTLCHRGRGRCPLNPLDQVTCRFCHRTCRSADCLYHHRLSRPSKKKPNIMVTSICSRAYKCKYCFITLDPKKRPAEHHVCGEIYCQICHRWFVDQRPHWCHMRSAPTSTYKTNKLIFYDFESTQESGTHIPNLVVAQSVCNSCKDEDPPATFCLECGNRCSSCNAWNTKEQQYEKYPCANGSCGRTEVVFRSDDVTQEFGHWLFSQQHKNCTALAHNAKGYDHYFLFRYCLTQSILPKVIFNGSKITFMNVARGLNIRCLDSCSFLPMPLAQLPQCFDLTESKKGFFPHFFNLPPHYGTVRQGLPSPESYGVQNMSVRRRSEFLLWYHEHRDDTFDFEKELLEYCQSDVDILRKSCLRYKQLMLEATQGSSEEIGPHHGVDPFGLISTASVCMAVFRSKFLPEEWRGVLVQQANPSCPHDSRCDCPQFSARKLHGDAPIESWDGQNWKNVQDPLHPPVAALWFVKSPIGLIPPSHYGPKDKYSDEALLWLRWMEEQWKISIQSATTLPEGEKVVFCPATRHHPPAFFRLDGYAKVQGQNYAFEFYGCHWHGCPHCYPATSSRASHTVLFRKTMEQRRQETQLRQSRLEHQGFKVIVQRSCQFAKELQDNPALQRFVHRQAPHTVCINVREAYYGGRCGALKIYHQFLPPTQGRLLDFTSLYPWALKYGTFPLSHPVKCYDLGTIEKRPCPAPQRHRFCPGESHSHHHLAHFGLIKVNILPPKDLLHPVLPYRSKKGKLLFPLCSTCADQNAREPCTCKEHQRAWVHTYCTPELEVALDMGYRILHVYEILSWPDHDDPDTQGVFASYVNTFLRIKQEASGSPCSPDQLHQYIQNYWEREHIHLRPSHIRKSTALRSLAKLLLNSFYGKFGQRLNLKKTHLVHSLDQLCTLMTQPEKTLLNFHILTEDIMQIETQDSPHFSDTHLNTNVVIAAFTTCYARIRLWKVLHFLGPRVFYTDTDSVLYEHIPGEPDPPEGNHLGDLVNEHSCKQLNCSDPACSGHFIQEFIGGGPKHYGYRLNTGEEICKLRGFSLNYTNSLQIHFASMKTEILHWFHRLQQQEQEQEEEEEAEEELSLTIVTSQICRDKQTATIFNKKVPKHYGIVYDKNQVLPEFITRPFGFSRAT